MFTPGRIYFIIFFVIAFIIGVTWAYRKEIKLRASQYKGTWKTTIGILVFLVLFASAIRLLKFL
jgi:hypothetical protein